MPGIEHTSCRADLPCRFIRLQCRSPHGDAAREEIRGCLQKCREDTFRCLVSRASPECFLTSSALTAFEDGFEGRLLECILGPDGNHPGARNAHVPRIFNSHVNPPADDVENHSAARCRNESTAWRRVVRRIEGSRAERLHSPPRLADAFPNRDATHWWTLWICAASTKSTLLRMIRSDFGSDRCPTLLYSRTSRSPTSARTTLSLRDSAESNDGAD